MEEAKKYKGKYRIASARLKNRDYAAPGKYFVTMCTKSRVAWFGEIRNEKMELSEIGEIVKREWLTTEILRSNVRLDDYVIMPNHIHGIIVIRALPSSDNHHRVETFRRNVSTPKQLFKTQTPEEKFNIPHPPSGSLARILGQFKSICTKQIRGIGYIDFQWQARYHDHIIRNEADLKRIQAYIKLNPAAWNEDRNFVADLCHLEKLPMRS